MYLSRKGSGLDAYIFYHFESTLCTYVLRQVYLTESVYSCEGHEFGITQNGRAT